MKFYYSDCWGAITDYNELKKESDILEKGFVKVDWEHLYKYCANNPKKAYYRKKIQEASQQSCV